MKRISAYLAVLPALFIATHASSAFAASEPLNVALVLDASGSMNGKLPTGTRKIVAAKSAVATFMQRVNPDINLSFRAYGHQFHRNKKNCKDTQLIVDFGAARKISERVVTSAKGLKAQGYTPITYVLGLAADDLKPTKGKHTIILVSDGKETCEGDPCLLAQKLAEADVDLVIHTIGFGVDATTRRQLQCIADKGRGEYFPANEIGELTVSLTTAIEKAETVPVKQTESLKVADKTPGTLEIRNAGTHDVMDAETGKKIARVSYVETRKSLPPGLYNVSFENGLWKSVEIKPNETTLLEPAVLRIANGYRHDVIDQETGLVVGKVSSAKPGSKAVLIPGRFDIQFEDTIWSNVVLEEGKTTILNAVSIQIKGAGMSGVPILDSSGKQIAKIRSTRNYASLPPGTYTLKFRDGQEKSVTLTEGKTLKISLK